MSRREGGGVVEAEAAGRPLGEVGRQGRDVLEAVPQRPAARSGTRRAVPEVLAEAALGDHRAQVAVGGGDDPDVDALRLLAADALEGAVLEDAQQAHLRGQRAARRSRRETGCRRRRARTSPAARCVAPVKLPRSWPKSSESTSSVGMAPQLTRRKGPGRPPRAVVDRTRHDLLAGAGLAEDQHRHVGLADLRDALHHLAQPRLGADDQLGAIGLAETGEQRLAVGAGRLVLGPDLEQPAVILQQGREGLEQGLGERDVGVVEGMSRCLREQHDSERAVGREEWADQHAAADPGGDRELECVPAGRAPEKVDAADPAAADEALEQLRRELLDGVARRLDRPAAGHGDGLEAAAPEVEAADDDELGGDRGADNREELRHDLRQRAVTADEVPGRGQERIGRRHRERDSITCHGFAVKCDGDFQRI